IATADISIGHAKRVPVEEIAVADRAPDLGELVDRLQVGFGGECDRVEGARATSHQAVRFDPRLEQGLEHRDAAGAPAPAAPTDKDESSLLVATERGRCPGPAPSGQHGRGSAKSGCAASRYVSAT